MRKKYYILVFTFLCLLIGQNSFAQTTGGDFDTDGMHAFLSDLFDREVSSFETDRNTGFIISVQGPGEGGGRHDGFVGFETADNGTITFTWGGFNDLDTTETSSQNTGETSSNSAWGFIDWGSVYSMSIPINPNGDCWSCSAETDNSDVASSENYNYFDLLPSWVQTSYSDFLGSSNSPVYTPPPNTGYSGTLGEVIIWYNVGTPYQIGESYGQLPIEEVNDTKVIMNSNSLHHELIFQFVKNNPGTGLDMLKTYLVSYPNGNIAQFIEDYNNPLIDICTNYSLLCAAETFETTNIAAAPIDNVLPKFKFVANKNNIFNVNGRPLRSSINDGNLLQIEVKNALHSPSRLLRTEGTLRAFGKMATYYAELYGYTGVVQMINTKGKDGGDDVAWYGNGVLTVRATAFSEGRFDNVNDFKSIIKHEVLHWLDPKTGDDNYKFKDHATIYLLQASDPDFKNTSDWHKINNANQYMIRIFNSSRVHEAGMNNNGIVAAMQKYNDENTGGVKIYNILFSNASVASLRFTTSINGQIKDNHYEYQELENTAD